MTTLTSQTNWHAIFNMAIFLILFNINTVAAEEIPPDKTAAIATEAPPAPDNGTFENSPPPFVENESDSEKLLNPTPAYAMLATSGVALLTGIITGSLALAVNSDLEDKCPQNACLKPQHDKVDRLDALATATDVLIPVSIVLAACGTAWLVMSKRIARTYKKREHAKKTIVEPNQLHLSGSSLIWRF